MSVITLSPSSPTSSLDPSLASSFAPSLLSATVVALLSSVALTSVVNTVNADESAAARGLYVGAGIGASQLEPESPIADLTIGDQNDMGFHVNVGYDFSRWLSAELQLADLGAAGIDRRLADGTGGTTVDTDFDAIEYRIVNVAALLYLFDTRGGFLRGRDADPGRRGLSLYTRIGAGTMLNDAERGRVQHENVEGGHLSVGLGLEYGFSNGFAARAEYISYDTDAQYASLSVLKRFGERQSSFAAPIDTSPGAALPEPTVPLTTAPSAAASLQPLSTEPVGTSGRFAFDSAALSVASRDSLAGLAAIIGESDDELIIEGHTDSTGTASYNDDLGLRRARAARDYLIGLGIAPERLRIESYGEQQPMATNATRDGRALNRRFEIRAN